MTRVTDWLATRPLREQGLMLAAVVLLLVYLGITLLWWPLMAERRAVLARTGQIGHALTAVTGLPARAVVTRDDRPLARVLTETAPEFGLSIRRIDVTDGGADLTLDDAAFDGVVLWLDALEGQHGMSVAALQITRRPVLGQVAATMTLKAAP